MIDIAPEDLVACICEGSSEKYIIELLLEDNRLCFAKSQLLSGAILSGKYRRSLVFQNEFLTFDYGEKKIVVLVVQDRPIGYKLRSPYDKKVKSICSLITRPEIEMLMIHSLGLDKQFGKQKKKPSVFLQEELKVRSAGLKSRDYIKGFYSKNNLMEAIIEHKRITQAVKGHYFLADILK